MKRRHFIQTSAVAGFASMLPYSSWAGLFQDYSKDILIGKGNPEFFGEGYRLQEEAHLAFEKMRVEALKEDINIQVVSSYRSFSHQKRIWERKYKRYTNQGLSPLKANNKIIEYSTIPGTSRHHWGTDLDIIDGNQKTSGDVLVPSKFHGDGPFCKLKDWLEKNSERFGFYLVYTDNANRKGFKYEPWHYSFAEISIPMLTAYRRLDIRGILKTEKLSGSQAFSEDFMQSYIDENILDLNAALL